MNEDEPVNDTMIEKALEAFGWDWLRDKYDNYLVRMAADERFGDLRTEYRFALWAEFGNALVMRLYGWDWFAGQPAEVRSACDTWNQKTIFPKATLVVDDEGDSRLLLEWGVPCWDQPVSPELPVNWIANFHRGCSTFLERYSEPISSAQRFVRAVSRSLN